MMDRRSLMTAALAAIAAVTSNRQSLAQAGMSRITAYAFSFPGLAGGDIRLSEFSGRPMLIVNTASLCGFTPQYGGLQELWTEFSDRGLMIIGVIGISIAVFWQGKVLNLLTQSRFHET